MGIYVYVVCVYVNKYCESNVLRAQMCFSHWLWWQEFPPFIMSCDMFYLLVVEIAPNCMIYTCICKYICIYRRIYLNILFIGQHSLLSTVTVHRADILSVWSNCDMTYLSGILIEEINTILYDLFLCFSWPIYAVSFTEDKTHNFICNWIPYFKMYYWYRLYLIF